MKTAIRTFVYLALIVWMGAEVLFPVVAAVTFHTLKPDTHTAGRIVGQLLRILHGMGLVSGLVLLLTLALALVMRIYKPRLIRVAIGCLLLMIAGTVYSQFSIIPAMERDRISAGGAIDAANPSDPSRIDFERLHKRSVHVEGVILLLGLATVVLIAKAETDRT
jgi:hypothetical protein